MKRILAFLICAPILPAIGLGLLLGWALSQVLPVFWARKL